MDGTLVRTGFVKSCFHLNCSQYTILFLVSRIVLADLGQEESLEVGHCAVTENKRQQEAKI